jgi:hypothetical protein
MADQERGELFEDFIDREAAGFATFTPHGIDWNRVYGSADGSLSVENQIEGLINGGARWPVPPDVRSPPNAIKRVARLRAGARKMTGDLDAGSGGAPDVTIPRTLFRNFVFVRDPEAGSYLVACDERPREVGPRYYDPRFVEPEPASVPEPEATLKLEEKAYNAGIANAPVLDPKRREERLAFLMKAAECGRSTARDALSRLVATGVLRPLRTKR